MRILLVALLLLPATADAGKRNRLQEPPPPEPPAVISGSSAMTQSPGSLFTEVQARQLMGMDSRQAGDLITVLVSESSSTTLDAGTSTSRESSIDAAIVSLLGAEKTLQSAHPNLAEAISIGAGSSAAAPCGGEEGAAPRAKKPR